MRRREFLTLSAASVGGVLVYSLDREVFAFPHKLTNPFVFLFGFSLNRRLSLLPPPPHESFRAMKWVLARGKQVSPSISTGR
jgi:hypothetical protein